MRGRTFAAALALVFCAVLLAPGAVTAQDSPDNQTEQNQSAEVTNQMGDLIVHQYQYEDGTMLIDVSWEGRAPTTLTLTEMIELDSAGSTEISFQTVRLTPHSRQTIEIGARERSGGTAAVMLSTTHSVERGEALVLQAGDPSTRDPIPFDLAMVAVGLTAGGTFAVGIALLVRKRNKEDRGRGQEI